MTDNGTPQDRRLPTAGWWRRRVVIVPLVAVVVTSSLVAVIAFNDDGEVPVRTVAADSGATSTTAAPTTSTTTTQVPPPSTTTTGKPESTTTSPPSTTTTTVPRRCEPADIAVSVTTDKTSYSLGETVKITIRATNTSDTVCRSLGEGASWQALDGQGRAVAVLPPSMTEYPRGTWPRWSPGAPRQEDSAWRQQCSEPSTCDSDTVPAGDYTIEATWLGAEPASTTIHIE